MSDATLTFLRLVQGLFAACLVFVGANYLQNPNHVQADIPSVIRLKKLQEKFDPPPAPGNQSVEDVVSAPDRLDWYDFGKRYAGWIFIALGVMTLFLGPTAFVWWLRICLALLFIYTGVVKIKDPGAFSKNIACYLLVPSQMVNMAAFVLPVLEVLAGVALLLPWTRNAGAIVIAGMLLAFAAVTGYANYIGPRCRLRLFERLAPAGMGQTLQEPHLHPRLRRDPRARPQPVEIQALTHSLDYQTAH